MNLKEEERILEEEVKDLQNKLKEKLDRLHVVKGKIADKEGVPEDLEDIRPKSENFIKDKKKRSRPEKGFYNEYNKGNYNQEYNQRINKRQKRIDKGKITSPKNIEDSESEDEQQRKIPEAVKKIESLLEEISDEEFENTGIIDESVKELPQLFHKAFMQEEKVTLGKRKRMLYWYEYAEEFKKKKEILEEETLSEKIAIGRIYKEIQNQYPKYTENNIKEKTKMARRIFGVIVEEGGKEKIKKLKKLNISEYKKLKNEEIDIWRKWKERHTLEKGKEMLVETE